MMTKDEVKKSACREIDAHADELIALGRKIWSYPEPGYEEFRTAEEIAKVFRSLRVPVREHLAVTGVRADIDTGREGPCAALLGELDALVMKEHPEANPANGAAHACGHNGQIVMLAGAAYAFARPEIREPLSGHIALIACPAEECRLKKPDNVRYLGGKQELIRLGVFDDADVVWMTHASPHYHISETSNGFVMKRVRFHGKASHAGDSPWNGVNALTAARLALSALDMQRDTFKDSDVVRIHGIIVNGGSAVNIVPEEVELEYQIRAKTTEAVRDASTKFDRCMHAGALAMGGSVTVETVSGYMPMNNDPEMKEIHRENMEKLVPGAVLASFGHAGSSTDFGDITMIRTACLLHTAGWKGSAHTVEFQVSDEYKAYVEPAKLMVMDVIDTLYGDAAEGKRLAAKRPPMTKEEYLDFLESMNSTREYGE